MYIELIVGCSITFFAGWNLSKHYHREKLLTYVRERATQESEPMIQPFPIRIEKINNELFVYEISTGIFIGRYNNGKELVADVKSQVAKKYGLFVRVTIHPEDGAEYVAEYADNT